MRICPGLGVQPALANLLNDYSVLAVHHSALVRLEVERPNQRIQNEVASFAQTSGQLTHDSRRSVDREIHEDISAQYEIKLPQTRWIGYGSQVVLEELDTRSQLRSDSVPYTPQSWPSTVSRLVIGRQLNEVPFEQVPIDVAECAGEVHTAGGVSEC
jgi:hypothetical protein